MTEAPNPGVPVVRAVALSPLHGFSKTPRNFIRLLQGEGVDGDAHCGKTVQHVYLKRRNASAPNRMQVHLLASEFLDSCAAAGYQLGPGEFGENVTTAGVDLTRLPKGTRLLLGPQAVVELTGLRTPCRQIDDRWPGLKSFSMGQRAEGSPRAKAGVMAVVLAGGTVAPQDTIRIELPPGPHEALSLI